MEVLEEFHGQVCLFEKSSYEAVFQITKKTKWNCLSNSYEYSISFKQILQLDI